MYCIYVWGGWVERGGGWLFTGERVNAKQGHPVLPEPERSVSLFPRVWTKHKCAEINNIVILSAEIRVISYIFIVNYVAARTYFYFYVP